MWVSKVKKNSNIESGDIMHYLKDIKNVQYNVNMGKYTTFRTGGTAKALIAPKSLEELKACLKVLNENNTPYVVIGNGSNILFAKEVYEGVVIRLDKDFESTEIKNVGNKYKVGAGVLLITFANKVCRDGYTGIEFGTGIPGTVGGAVYMNAGCYGREIVDCCINVTALDRETLEVLTFEKSECDFTYRNSFFQNDKYIILSAEFEFIKGELDQINEKVAEYKKQRTDKQPLNLPNAGSTFKRPLNDFAGRLIEEAGLKGYRVGGAQVSEKHAGFVVNSENAKPEDIIKLTEDVIKLVFEKFGVKLELEIKVI